MRPLALASLLLLTHLAPAAADEFDGRWRGAADLGGVALPIVLDLTRDDGGRWIGSVILPGRAVKGAPLRAVQVEGSQLRASLESAFPFPVKGGASIRIARRADDTLAGELQQAELTAPLTLRRVGVAQVDRPAPDRPLAPGLAGTWIGQYELGGYGRDVTLKLEPGPAGSGRGDLKVVGRRTTEVAIDEVTHTASFVVLRASSIDYRIEGRWSAADGRIVGQVIQGPYEADIVLRRATASPARQP